MNPVKATFVTTNMPFSTGASAAGFLLTLTKSVDDDSTPEILTGRASLDEREIVISDVPVGTYTGKIALVDAGSAELAPAVLDPAPLFIANTQSIALPVPVSLTLTRP